MLEKRFKIVAEEEQDLQRPYCRADSKGLCSVERRRRRRKQLRSSIWLDSEEEKAAGEQKKAEQGRLTSKARWANKWPLYLRPCLVTFMRLREQFFLSMKALSVDLSNAHGLFGLCHGREQENTHKENAPYLLIVLN